MSIESNLGVIPDLKAFERRLTEVIACLQPSTNRWRGKLKYVYLIYIYNPYVVCKVLVFCTNAYFYINTNSNEAYTRWSVKSTQKGYV